ncbi:hypothetical protein BFJ65_g18565 [Fusarium oxysporum f. sp. cepae]|uniref:HTH CENPB-type domain-containing protein n=1 Tax=Fusarium oxysporum f. sp. cepae TaxID=396571 RepID=A0A3L6MP50_FUSOX|nr:hypothetical protein BFJ65_g18565 [Fusarium oxysporum f. sp. cepae]
MSSVPYEARVNLALEAIQKDQNLSIRAAAKIYGVSDRTIRRRRDGSAARHDTVPNSRKLTQLEEEVIVQYVIELCTRSFPPRLRGVEDMANQLLRTRDASAVGKNWASNSVRRRPELHPKVISEWFALVWNVKAKYGILDEDTYNFDEIGFMMGIIFACMVVTTSDGRGKAKLAQPGNREWATVIQGVNAQGWAIPPFIILAAQYHLANWYTESNLPADWMITTTDNGWTTNEVGLDWIKHFDKHTASPARRWVFGPMKKAYGRQIEDLMRAHITHVSKVEFLRAFREAFFASMTEKNIQGGFMGAGLVPHDPERVLSKLDVRIRTPTPTLPPSTSADPWIPKTPQNPLEANSQSELIKTRISNHQNSSPMSMINAVDQFAKGAKAIMHRVALLEAEVSSLRKANEALSKRRRAKRARVRLGGSLTVQDAQYLLAKKAADEKTPQERQQNGSYAGSAR